MFDLDERGRGSARGTADRRFLEREIARFKASARRREMLMGERYYRGRHDILGRRRMAIGEGGQLTELGNLPNNRVVDNQYRKAVSQKASYLLGQPLTFRAENPAFGEALRELTGPGFHRMMKNLARDALNQGIAWVYPRIDGRGELRFKALKGHQVIPGWRDAEHTELDYAVRLYSMLSIEGEEERVVEKAEVFDEGGVWYFQLKGGELIPEAPWRQAYFSLEGKYPYNWTRIPLVAFRRDGEETPLIRGVKSLQDGLNSILSTFQNNLEEDPRNSIMILVNYDGENLGEFRRNLAQYGAVKVRTVDGAPGDLRTLAVEVDAENYRAILEVFRRAILENAMAFDAKDQRLGGTPNQMNIQSMYSDVDLDANDMEAEFQAGLEQLFWFARCHLANSGAGDFTGEPLEIIFNRDLPMVEGDVIANIRQSVGILSEETLVAQHPWVDDVGAEMARKAREARGHV